MSSSNAAGAPIGTVAPPAGQQPLSLLQCSVAFYAHKSGVGKSTLLFDTAYGLSKKIAANGLSINVVIVDADSQLNTSFKLLKRSGYQVDLIDALVNQGGHVNNGAASRHVRISMDGGTINKSKLYTHICGTTWIPTRPFNLNDDLITVRNTGDRVHLLLGTPILHTLELQLINAIQNSTQHPATQHVPLLFYELLNKVKQIFAQTNGYGRSKFSARE